MLLIKKREKSSKIRLDNFVFNMKKLIIKKTLNKGKGTQMALHDTSF